MELAEALEFSGRGAVSLVGGGGKTTLMFRLARELADKGSSVVTGTTTRIRVPDSGEAGAVVTDGEEDSLLRAIGPGRVVCVGERIPGEHKLTAPPERLLRCALRAADCLILEADGARMRPVKAPAEYEPQIFEPSALVVAVAGLTALGRPVGEVCHRPELVTALLDVGPEAVLTPVLLARLLTSERGQRKAVGDPARFRILLNKADDGDLLRKAAETAGEIARLLPGCRVAAAALAREDCVRGVF